MSKKDKNKDKEEKEEKKGGNLPPGISNLAAIFLGGGKGAAAYGVAEVLKHDDFITNWQRGEGEPVLSTHNIAKMVAVLAGLGIYKHIDPFPDSRVDNYAVMGLAAYLLLLLGIPQQNELGGRLASAEAPILVTCLKHLGQDKAKIHDVMEWLGNLPNRQEQKILQVLQAALSATADNAEEQKLVAEMLADKTTRDFLAKFYGREPLPQDIKNGLQIIKKLFADYWPPTKEKLLAMDAHIAKTMRGDLRPWLAETGLITNKNDIKKRGWFIRLCYKLGK